ncbi:MAG: GCN5-related N-acetyltransferase [Myxococcaceae bacterium]|nr:GCN5-related N-acetyltransferase [Myxococcaceae bacterium]
MSSQIRRGVPGDVDAIGRLKAALWPDGSVEEHASESALILAGHPRSTMPLVLLVAEAAGSVVGFIEVGLRSHADGCDPMHPVGFVEGWYVVPEHRGQSVGRALMVAAEEWARAQGCREMASDTWLDNEPSQRAHEALGFEVVDRCVNFKKPLV